MTIFLIINLIIISTAVAYLAFRLGYNFWIFFIVSLILSPIISILILAIYDYYINLKGKQ